MRLMRKCVRNILTYQSLLLASSCFAHSPRLAFLTSGSLQFDLVQRQRCMNGDACKTWGCLYDHGTSNTTAEAREHPQIVGFRREAVERCVKEMVAGAGKLKVTVPGKSRERWAVEVVRGWVAGTLGKEGSGGGSKVRWQRRMLGQLRPLV